MFSLYNPWKHPENSLNWLKKLSYSILNNVRTFSVISIPNNNRRDSDCQTEINRKAILIVISNLQLTDEIEWLKRILRTSAFYGKFHLQFVVIYNKKTKNSYISKNNVLKYFIDSSDTTN